MGDAQHLLRSHRGCTLKHPISMLRYICAIMVFFDWVVDVLCKHHAWEWVVGACLVCGLTAGLPQWYWSPSVHRCWGRFVLHVWRCCGAGSTNAPTGSGTRQAWHRRRSRLPLSAAATQQGSAVALAAVCETPFAAPVLDPALISTQFGAPIFGCLARHSVDRNHTLGIGCHDVHRQHGVRQCIAGR